MNTETRQDQGYHAAARGKTRNPYKLGTTEHDEWQEGFDIYQTKRFDQDDPDRYYP